MRKLDVNIQTPAEAEAFILSCETDFINSLDAAINEITNRENTKIIALSGPTCSGKTTTAEKLIKKINSTGHHAVVMSIDDFFRDRQDRNRVDLEAPDYDSVNAIDLSYLDCLMTRLRAGQSILVPKYDFTATRRVGYHEYIPDPRDIYVIEGIQAVYPEITKMFGVYKSIFISVTDDVEYKSVTFESHEIRLLRRIVRDHNFRGATPEFSFHLWHGVRENEEKNIFPNAGGCDIFINSFLPYELFVICKHALPLLESVPKTSEYRAEADVLAEKLAVFDGENFDDRMIPKNSVFREFIG